MTSKDCILFAVVNRPHITPKHMTIPAGKKKSKNKIIQNI